VDWEKFKEKFFIFGFILIIAVTGLVLWEKIQFYRTTRVLNSITSQRISELRVYPKVTLPGGTFIAFPPQELIVEEFLQSVKDIRLRSSGVGSVISDEHTWFLEIVMNQGDIIQMECSIFSEYPDIVIGNLGKFKSGGLPYGMFQSQKLLQWYQKYSHLWLEPVESIPQQDTPHEVK
jgi:hypothetical protein